MHPIIQDKIVDGHFGRILKQMADISGREIGIFADGSNGQVRICVIVLNEFDDPIHGCVAVFSFVERIVILINPLNEKIFQLRDEGEILNVDPHILFLPDFFVQGDLFVLCQVHQFAN